MYDVSVIVENKETGEILAKSFEVRPEPDDGLTTRLHQATTAAYGAIAEYIEARRVWNNVQEKGSVEVTNYG